MIHTVEKNRFETGIDQRYFESLAVGSFFGRWCEVNDSIVPEVTSREEWEVKAAHGLLQAGENSKQILYIPADLQLWEMIHIIQAVDDDTFADKPERRHEAREKLSSLGETFENAGIYIAQRLDSIPQGQDIAASLAEDFYNYGESLIFGRKADRPSHAKDIAKFRLSEEETQAVDCFLAGDKLYKSRASRADERTFPLGKTRKYEAQRKTTLAQFFRVAEKAIQLQHTRGTQNAFTEKIEKAITREVEMPKREIVDSIFRRGMELLQKNMLFDKLPDEAKNSYLVWENGEKTLREALYIDGLRALLERAHQTGDVAIISQQEREITDIIQKAVNSFPYEIGMNSPSSIATDQQMNCLGASMLAGSLMSEIGLNYLVGDLPRHSILLLVTSNGRVEWRDMVNSKEGEELSDDMVGGKKEDGSPLKVADIIAFSKKQTSAGLKFSINDDNYKKKLDWLETGRGQYLTIFGSEYGQKIQLLSNIGLTLYTAGHNDEAVECLRQAIALDPQYPSPHIILGHAYQRLGNYEEAASAYEKTISIDPTIATVFVDFANILVFLGHTKEAIINFYQALLLNPKLIEAYSGIGDALIKLDRQKEAIQAYSHFVELAEQLEVKDRRISILISRAKLLLMIGQT